jgi:hypothetical protein
MPWPPSLWRARGCPKGGKRHDDRESSETPDSEREIRSLRAAYPEAHITLGLSNVSFGLPAPALINRTFLTLALGAGIDTAMIDPTDAELKAALLATELLLGHDRHCLIYTRAYRAGLIGVHRASGSPAQPGQAHATRET